MVLTSQCPGPRVFVCVPTVEYQIGVMAGPVCSTKVQKVAQLGLHRLQRDAAGGVVAAVRLDHVVGE